MSRMTLPLSFSAMLLAGTAMADVPRVVADIAPVHSLVARVMAGLDTPDLVIPAGASPHAYNLRPSEAAALQEAEVVFWIGDDLVPWLADAIATLAEGAMVTELLEADGVTLLDFREGALFEAHDHGHEAAAARDHDHGHDHDDAHDHDHDHDHGHEDAAAHDHDHDHTGHANGAHDPHAWLSLDNAAVWLDLIAARLSTADPDNAGAYFANAAAAKAEMETLRAEVAELLAPAEGGRFIVFHDAYQYFERTFDFPAAGAISISDAREPGPARIAEIQERIADEGISCVLAEPQFNPALVATVLEGTAARTAVLDPLGSDLTPGPDLYPQVIRNLGTALTACLTDEG